MFDVQTIEGLTEDLKRCAESGLNLLYVSGFLQATLARLDESILLGDQDQPAEQLAQEIRRFRQDRAILLELMELGRRFTKEQTR